MKLLLMVLILGAAAASAEAGWLPREVHEVRAFVYDYTQERGNDSLLKGGRFHKGVINDGGSKLTDEQVERLKDALRSSEKRKPGAFCYMPHHGFVFYDKAGIAMGHIELCFQCSNVASAPRGLPEVQWDWKAIRKLLEELKIPILKKNKDYTQLYNEKSANKVQAGDDQPAAAAEKESEDKAVNEDKTEAPAR